jgi:F-type H+-transporting ATPase subunit gamma
VQVDAYSEGRIGALYVIYTRFINTMKQEPVVEQVLPLPADRLTGDERAVRKNWDYLYEPDAKAVLEQLLKRYLEQIIYQSVAENIASEQSARMVAMKSASDNASSVIDDLTLVYNKSRQAAITKELSEIVGGAAAV